MRRFLVTGSSGYIGSRLLERLAARPDTLAYGFSRQGSVRREGQIVFQGDLLLDDIGAVLTETRPEVIFHSVGVNPLAPFEEQMRVHAEGTRRLLQALADHHLKPVVVVAGSAAEYGLRDEAVNEDSMPRPEGEYGICKLAQTQIAMTFARRYEIPVRVARIFNVYGRTMPSLVVASLASQIAALELGRARKQATGSAAIHAINLASSRDFIHIDDVTAAMLALADLPVREPWGGIYNVASGESVPIRRVLELLLKASTLENPEVEVRADQHPDVSRAEIIKIRQYTDWQPTVPLADGLREELDYWRHRVEALV